MSIYVNVFINYFVQIDELTSDLENALLKIKNLKEENRILKEENDILAKNISSLYRTATSEIRKLQSNPTRGRKPNRSKHSNHRRQNGWGQTLSKATDKIHFIISKMLPFMKFFKFQLILHFRRSEWSAQSWINYIIFCYHRNVMILLVIAKYWFDHLFYFI